MSFLKSIKNKREDFKFFLIILFSIGVLFIALFLLLPDNIQQSLAIAIYVFSAFFGLFIGSLISQLNKLKQRLNREKEEFKNKNDNIYTYLANVVHDLRSPVASIYMIAELLENDLTEISDSERTLISSIRKTSSGMLDRICCILDNSRYEKGINVDGMEASNPYELLESAIKKHEIFAIEKNILIDLLVKNELPDAYFDRDALDSIFCNLISNAIKYSMPNTVITISHAIEKRYIKFMIKDQGLGMTTDDLKKVFGQFSKLSARPTGNESSSGLGLSIVKKFVELMGGEVFAYSEGTNMGSTFSFTLRIPDKPQLKSQNPAFTFGSAQNSLN
jgi:two-component system, sensor histidine kinase and response regulator